MKLAFRYLSRRGRSWRAQMVRFFSSAMSCAMALSLAMKLSAARTSAMLSVSQSGKTGCALAIRPHAATNHRRRSVRFRHQPELTTIRLQCKRRSIARMIDGQNGAGGIDLTGRERRPVGRGFHSRNSRSIESNDPSAIASSMTRWSLTPRTGIRVSLSIPLRRRA